MKEKLFNLITTLSKQKITMKVILTNFKCYAYREFAISENEITLIHGPSGIGKSTICAAINFVLYGSGNKVVKHDKNACSVEIIFEDGRVFKRSKRPNFLSVTTHQGTVYTDDAAQEIINKDFGSAFDITGYLEQGSSNSFLLMTPANKSEFLERFAFRDVDLSSLKERAKALIKESEAKVESIQGQLQMLRNLKEMLKKVDKPAVNVEYLSTQNEAQFQQQIDAYSSEIKRIDQEISELKQTQTDIVILNASKTDKKSQLAQQNVEYTHLQNEFQEVSSKQLPKEEIKKLQEQLQHILHFQKVAKCKEDLDLTMSLLSASKKVEMDQHAKRVQQVQEELAAYTSKYEKDNTKYILHEQDEEDIIQLQNVFSQILKLNPATFQTQEEQSNLIQSMTSELASLEGQKEEITQLVYKLESQLSILTCPSCEALLRKIDDCLVSVNDPDIIESDDLMADIYKNKQELGNISKKISELQKSMSSAKMRASEIAKLDELVQSFQQMFGSDVSTAKEWIFANQKFISGYISDCKKILLLKKEFQKLQNFTFSEVVTTAEKKSELKKKEYDQLVHSVSSSSLAATKLPLSEGQIYQVLSEQDAVEKAITSLSKRLAQCQNSLSATTSAIDDLDKKLQSFNINTDQLSTLLHHKHAQKLDLQSAQEQAMNELKDFRKYFEYNHYIGIINSYNTQIDDLVVQEQDAVNKLTGANRLKELISEAEGQAIASLIDSINSHARIFLDDFFPENPISVLLNPFKEVKKGAGKTVSLKPQINVEIEYKEMSCGVDSLSGGEVARISLAYTLALAEMINSPILMLDECTSSLDADMSSIVIESIKAHMSNKTIIVIAHQAEVGAYDHVISLV